MVDLDKVDRRVERTHNAILKAFKEMIVDMDFKEITIKDLAIRAGINRKTFYLHYQSLDDVLFDLTMEISDGIFNTLTEKGFFKDNTYSVNVLVDTIDVFINDNYELTKILVSANSYRFFSRNIKDIIKDAFIRKIRSRTSLNQYMLNLLGDYIGSGVAKLLKDWFSDPGNLSSKDISKIATDLIYGGISRLIRDKDLDLS